MGQYFIIINLDKREILTNVGKLAEGIANREGSLLIPYLFLSSDPQPPPQNGNVGNGSWAGDRIICPGDYGTDVPDGILTAEEIEEISGGKKDKYGRNIVNLYHYASSHFKKLPSQPHFNAAHYPSNMVLRNLTLHTYVRADAVSGRASLLGSLILSRIPWSSDPPGASLSHWPDIGSGPWAGHRFDIRTMDDIESGGADGEEWKDVSLRAREWIRKLLKSV